MQEKKQQVLKGKMKIVHLDKRFGVIALEKGFVTADQVVDALKTQVEEDLSSGTHRLIGRILLEKQAITFSQLDEVLVTMETTLEKVHPMGFENTKKSK
jgi:predicted transcriptional regulator